MAALFNDASWIATQSSVNDFVNAVANTCCDGKGLGHLLLAIREGDATMISCAVCAVVILLCFVTSQATGNASQVDKLWSVIPAVYGWIFAAKSGFAPRAALVAVLVSAWAIRLTANFARRGGYDGVLAGRPWDGEQDYRWPHLRTKTALSNPALWVVFDLVFVAAYQNVLLLAIVAGPMAVVAAHGNVDAPLGAADALLTLAFATLLWLEAAADDQQYAFQTEKYRRIAAGGGGARGRRGLSGEYALGYCRTGLWAVVRHPNYACEQGLWVVVYLFSWAAGGGLLNWSCVGAALLVALFRPSSDLSEGISAAKYPRYRRQYMATVPRFVPGPARALAAVIAHAWALDADQMLIAADAFEAAEDAEIVDDDSDGEEQGRQESDDGAGVASIASSDDPDLAAHTAALLGPGGAAFGVGATVAVASRTGPGENHPGGVAVVGRVVGGGDAYDVRYVLGGSEKAVPSRFVFPTNIMTPARAGRRTRSPSRKALEAAAASPPKSSGKTKKKAAKKTATPKKKKATPKKKARGRSPAPRRRATRSSARKRR